MENLNSNRENLLVNLPTHILEDILLLSGNLLSASLVCINFHETIAKSSKLMERIHPMYTYGKTCYVFKRSIRKYNRMFAKLPKFCSDEVKEYFNHFPRSLNALKILFVNKKKQNKIAPNARKPQTSSNKKRITFRFSNLKVLIVTAMRDYNFFQIFSNAKLKILVVNNAEQDILDCKIFENFLTTQNELEILKLDLKTSQNFFSKSFELDLKLKEFRGFLKHSELAEVHNQKCYEFLVSQRETLQKVTLSLVESNHDKILPIVLYKLPKLVNLDLDLYEFTFDHTRIVMPCHANVRLDLLGNQGIVMSNSYMHLIKNLPNIKRLVLRSMKINHKTYLLINNLKSLEELILESCTFETFEKFLKMTSLTLDHINVKDCDRLFKRNKQLKSVKFMKMHLCQCYWGSFLRDNKNIINIEIPKAHQVSSGVVWLKEFLRYGGHLNTLVLSAKVRKPNNIELLEELKAMITVNLI